MDLSDDDRINAVQFLLKHGAHVNAGDYNLMTPLHFATTSGCHEVARILLEHGADAGLQNDDGQVPLHLVSELSDKDLDEDQRLVLAQLLLTGYGADVNAQDIHGETPLHRASFNSWPKIVQLLLDNGANPHADDVQGRKPLHKLLPNTHWYKWKLANRASHDVLRVTQLLLEQGVNANLDKDHETPLHIASSCGRLEITQLLLDQGAKADAENVHGQTPLHLVSQTKPCEENPNVTRLLLKCGVDVNTRDKQQATPLHFASSSGHFEIARALLRHGANVNAQNAGGQTPLHQVSLYFHPEYFTDDYDRVAKLLLHHGADVNARDTDHATPLHIASYMSKLRVARVLLDHGANIHAKNAQGQTPLHIVSHGTRSSEYCKLSLLELLLGRGAEVNARDNDQATPYLLACIRLKPNWQTAPKLLQNGADVSAVNIHGQNAWHLISQNLTYDYRETLRARMGELLLDYEVGMHGRDEDERTPLHLACYHGQFYVADMLLEEGAQVDAVDVRGHTPLHQVLLGNHHYQSFSMSKWDLENHPRRVLRLAQRLLENGADINAQNKDQETPLHLASCLRLHEMARLLLKHGANVNAKNSQGKSPLQVATRRKGKAMRRLLSEFLFEYVE